MDWFLYDNGLHLERVNDHGEDNEEVTVIRYLHYFLFLNYYMPIIETNISLKIQTLPVLLHGIIYHLIKGTLMQIWKFCNTFVVM